MKLVGFFRLSVGDLLYGLVVGYIIFILIRWVKNKIRKQPSQVDIKVRLIQMLSFFFCLYIIFNIFWGLNYNRKGISYQLGLKVEAYEVNDLIAINKMLVEKMNSSRIGIVEKMLECKNEQLVFEKSQSAYKQSADYFPFFKYSNPSVKKSMWGWFGNYAGFTGYYNPFTGEAQVNTTIPVFLQPFVCCHEIAHQLGYAKENEANFVAYLTAIKSSDTLLQYSAYFEMFLYANRNLSYVDSAQSRIFRNQLSDTVKKDIKELISFQKNHQSKIEPIVSFLYGLFLKSNQQPKGVMSYDEVTGLLIAYHKKYQ
jgi:hypothetical protein